MTVEEQLEQIDLEHSDSVLLETEQVDQTPDIPTPEEIKQQYDMAEAYDRFVEVWGHHVVADPLTGELINLFDANIPVQQKADAAQWVLEKLENEQEMCEERQQQWSDKGKKIQGVIKKIRATIFQQMQQEGTEKIKTPENTFYISSNTNTSIDYSKVPLDNRKVRVIEECSMQEALEMGYSIDQMEFIGVVHPEDLSEDAVVKFTHKFLVIRTRK